MKQWTLISLLDINLTHHDRQENISNRRCIISAHVKVSASPINYTIGKWLHNTFNGEEYSWAWVILMLLLFMHRSVDNE